MPRVDRKILAENARLCWEGEVARPHAHLAASIIDDDDLGRLSASTLRRRLERARDLAAHLYLLPMALPANGVLKRKLMRSSNIAINLDRDDVRSCYVWQANDPKAIRSILEDLDEAGVADAGERHAWTVKGDRGRYHRCGAYVLAASRRRDTPAHGVLFASRELLVDPICTSGILPILRIELDYVYVRRSMRRRGVAYALAAEVVDQAISDLTHLVELLVARPKRDRKLAISLVAENHSKGGERFVEIIHHALEGFLSLIIDDRVENCGVLDHVDWL